MIQIMIAPKDSKANIMLSFITNDSAQIAHKNIHERIKLGDTILTQKDDFGYVLEMNVDNISYCLLVDIENEQEVIMQSAIARNKASSNLYEKYKNDSGAMQLLRQAMQPSHMPPPQNKPKLEL